MVIGFVLMAAVCTKDGDCSVERSITDDVYATRAQCMAQSKRINEKYVVCGEVHRGGKDA